MIQTKMMFPVALAVSALALASTAQAGRSWARVAVQATTTPVDVFFSSNGESKIAFVARVGRWMETWSQVHKIEICGDIQKSVKTPQWSISLYTSGSHLGCETLEASPEDFVMVNQTIHTHGASSMFRVNAEDIKWSSIHLHLGQPHGGVDVWHFSDQDRREAGFLVTPSDLRFQDGTSGMTRHDCLVTQWDKDGLTSCGEALNL